MMRLAVVLSDLAAPPRTGLQQQSLLLLEGLVASGIEIDLFAFAKAPGDIDEATLPVRLAAPVMPMRVGWTLTGLCGRLPLNRLAQRLADYDAVYLEGAAAAGLLRRPWADRAVINLIDPGSRRRMRFARAARGFAHKARELVGAGLAYAIEASVNRPLTEWVVVSASDAEYLRRVHGHGRTSAIPVMLPPLPSATTEERRNGTNVTIYADLREPHMWKAFCDWAGNVFRPATSACPEMRLRVLGRLVPTPEQRAMLPDLSIDFVGWSDDHIRELQRADVVVLPDAIGTGIKNRAVECLGLGCAVVGTSVAFEAIPVENGREAMVVADHKQAVEALLQLVSSPTKCMAMRENARNFAAAHYGRDQVIARWLQLLQSRSRPHE